MGITSPSKGILEVNDELCRILGYSREELLEKTWAELTHPDDLPQDLFNFDRVMAREIEGYSLEKRWIRKDGQIVNGIMAAKCHRRRTVTSITSSACCKTSPCASELKKSSANSRPS